MRTTTFIMAVACIGALSTPAVAQSRKSDHWVATWAPALVVRAAPAAPRQGGPGGPGGPAAAPAAAVPQAGAGGAGAPAAPPRGGGPSAAAPAGPAGPGGPGGPGGGRGGGRGAAPPVTLNNQTVRQIVHTTLGGRRVRVVLSNAFGTAPLQIGAAHAALRECADSKPGCARKAETAIAGPAKPITVDGKTAFTVVAGGSLVSDPIELDVPAVADLVIDLFIPAQDAATAASPIAWHSGSSQTSYVSAEGNFSGAATIDPIAARPASWFLISRVEVAAASNAGAIAAFGDSITDGAVSTLDTNSRWPDVLARRVEARKGGRPLAVVNVGISGNRLLGDGAGVAALARFDRDVLMQTGVTHVIILEGINDIGVARAAATPSAEDLIAAHKQMILRAKAKGLTVVGATLTPFEGAAYYTPEGEAKREALNQWIRTSGEYDAVIDFDKITRDPMNPKRFNPLYDSGDHLHPKDAGYQAMGEAIDLALFK